MTWLLLRQPRLTKTICDMVSVGRFPEAVRDVHLGFRADVIRRAKLGPFVAISGFSPHGALRQVSLVKLIAFP